MALKRTETGILIPALPRPTIDELRYQGKNNRPWIREIHMDVSPTESVRLVLARIVGGDEESIDWGAYITRLDDEGPLGYQQAVWLRQQRDSMTAEERLVIDEIIPRNFIDFPGLVIVRDDGSIGVPVMMQKWDIHFMSADFICHRRVALGVPVE